MSIVERTQQRFFLVIATVFTDRTRGEDFFVKLVPILEAPRRHATRRTNRVRGLLRERNVERAVFAAQKTGGGERLEFLAFAVVEALADIDEGRHRRIERA